MTSEAAARSASPVTRTAARPKGVLSKRAFARMSWGVLDQGISSLTNFAVAFFLAHTLTPAGLGAYSLTYLTYGFALNASRGMSTDPLLVRYSGVDVQR